MTTLAILQGALTLLHRDGWGQGQGFLPDGRICLGFAVGLSTLELGLTGTDPAFDEAWRILGSLGAPVEQVIAWNDAPARTFTDVVALLTAAAAIAKQAQPLVQRSA